MKIVTRYILREVINPFSIGVFAFTFLFLANGMFRLMDWIIIGGIRGSLVGGMVLSLIPFIMNVTFPMALLLGCVFAFGRLSEQNEIQALMACGHTYGRIVRPVILLGVACTGFLLFWSEYVAPKASLVQNMITFRIVEHMSPIAVLEEGKFSTRLPGRVLYLQKIDLADHTVHGVAIFEMEGNKIRAALLSPRGRVHYDSQKMTLSLDLENWEVHVDMESDDPKMATIDGSIQMVVDCSDMMGRLLRDKQLLMGLSRSELRNRRQEIIQSGSLDRDAIKTLERIETEISNRIVLPFACLVLAALGAPLGFWMQRGSRGACFALALGVILTYYFLMGFGSSLVDRGVLSIYVGAWVPNVVMGLVGIAANVHLARR